MPKRITQEYLKQILSYNQDTGLFSWLVDRKSNKVKGKSAGSPKEGYLVIHIDGENHRAHSLAWLYVNGVYPDELDHINRVKNDNRICNLRLADRFINCQNRNIAYVNKTGCSGVSITKKGKFIAQITVNKVYRYLGTFLNVDDAISARKNAESKYGFGGLSA